MKLRGKIAKIIEEHESHLPKYTCRLQVVNAILSLIQQEIRECLGEDEHRSDEEDITDVDEIRNQLRSDIKEKLKEKGL